MGKRTALGTFRSTSCCRIEGEKVGLRLPTLQQSPRTGFCCQWYIWEVVPGSNGRGGGGEVRGDRKEASQRRH